VVLLVALMHRRANNIGVNVWGEAITPHQFGLMVTYTVLVKQEK